MAAVIIKQSRGTNASVDIVASYFKDSIYQALSYKILKFMA